MAPDDNRAQLGRILQIIGYVWGGLFVASNFFNFGTGLLGDILSFFGSSLFIPIALIFGGRILRRRGSRPTPDGEVEVPQPSPRQRPPDSPPRDVPREEPRRREPQLVDERRSTPTPRELAPERPSVEDLAAVIGFEDGVATGEDKPDVGTGREPSQKPMSSEERIEEARRRFNR